jgi:hypothetical protein
MSDVGCGRSKSPIEEPTRGLKTLEAENKHLREALRRFGEQKGENNAGNSTFS